MRTLVLPRGLASRMSVFMGRKIVYGGFLYAARRLKTYEAKDKLLATGPAAALLSLLFMWLSLFILGYALLFYGVIDTSLGAALRESGSSMLTLGFATTPSAGATLIDFFAAATGLITTALLIAYLPVLYAAFNRRETLVTMLQSRAGAPAWGPEILARHQNVGLTASLPDFFHDWERWAADVAESHANYQVLIWFRSPHPYRSWTVALLAVMDSAALYLSLNPTSAPTEARLLLRMGFTGLRDIAGTLKVPFDPDPFPDDPIELTYEEFMDGVSRLEGLGFPMERTPEEAWPHFKGWRVNYEKLAYFFCDETMAPPGPWTGPRSRLPGEEITPQRPANRTPESPEDEGREKGHVGH
ncbi:MAG: hypothetical protein H0U53_01550 [Actinobacteria bacterium]|nr:hypothetical protein [Actinomycetota bacterium]